MTNTFAKLFWFLNCLVFIVSNLYSDKTPNIILILTDDHGWSQLSTAVDKRFPEAKSNYLHTPNINRLANAGMRFTNGYSPAPLCTPTRRSIQLGASAARSGTEFRSSCVPAEHLTIPKALKMVDSNFQCAHFGKWGEHMISTPEECGYDKSDGMTGNNTGGMEDKLKEGHVVEDPKRTESITNSAIQFIAAQAEAKKPFYCQISYYAMHLRVEALQKTWDKYKQKGKPDRAYTHAWAAMLEELDDNIGKLLDVLDEQNLSETTYIVFTTDNGGRGIVPGGDSKSIAPNHPVRGAKHSLWEGGIRVPFFIKGPEVEAMSYENTPVVAYDFLPTFYELAGGSYEPMEGVDGGSLAHLLKGDSSYGVKRPEPALYFHRPKQRESVIRQGEYKLILRYEDDGDIQARELYKVDKDISESKNLIATYAEKSSAMEKQLLNYLKKVDAEKVEPKPKKKKKK